MFSQPLCHAVTCSRTVLATQPASFSRHQSCRHQKHRQQQSPASSILSSHLPSPHYQMLPRGGGWCWCWPGHGDNQEFNLISSIVSREVKQERDGKWRFSFKVRCYSCLIISKLSILVGCHKTEINELGELESEVGLI